MIDVNVAFGPYPFRDLPDGAPHTLVQTLRSAGITQAWTCSLEALLHQNLGAVNARLAQTCREVAPVFCLPCGAINPAAPGWQTDLQRCVTEHGMSVIRLFPSYHGYDFQAPEFAELLQRAQQSGLVVQIVWRVEDERTEHPLIKPTPLTAAALLERVRELPTVKLMLLNSSRDVPATALEPLLQTGRVTCDLANLEGVGGIERWLVRHPTDRLVFGSYAPVFVPAAAVGKLQESELPQPLLAAITRTNAEQLLKG